MADRTPESPKRFFKQVLERGPYYELLKLMEANPNWTVRGSVDSDRGHYVHENSTDVHLEIDGWLGDDYGPTSETDAAETAAGKVVDAVQEDLQDKVRDWNRTLTQELYASLEDMQSDDQLIDWMNNAAEWYFDDDGELVDMTDYVPVSNLKPGIRDKILREYADLFERTPEQVYTALMQRDYRFDKRGNRIDITQFKKITDLEEPVRKRLLDKYRDILVENEDAWATPVEDDWQQKLEEMGFERIKIRYSLGYSQGDGASFTADNIDMKKLCEAMMRKQKTEAVAQRLVTDLIE